MAEFIKVNGQEYPATCIYNYKDRNWDMRETQTVQLTMTAAEAAALPAVAVAAAQKSQPWI